MRGINKAIIIGTVGQDPQVKYMPSGGAVVNLSVATNEEWKDKATGEKKSRCDWHKLTFYNRLAEIVGEYVRKGQQIYIEGRLRTRDYEKDGQKHYVTEIMVDEMQMLGGKAQGAQGQRSAPAQPTGESAGDFQDDDIPF